MEVDWRLCDGVRDLECVRKCGGEKEISSLRETRIKENGDG